MAGEEYGVEYWQIRLQEIDDELSEQTGRPGFSIGGMTTDEAGNYERLNAERNRVTGIIASYGQGNSDTRNSRIKSGGTGAI